MSNGQRALILPQSGSAKGTTSLLSEVLRKRLRVFKGKEREGRREVGRKTEEQKRKIPECQGA